jgi:hypothetical protein
MEETIHRLQAEFDRAELTADLDTLRRLLANDFVSIGPKGFMLDKNEWINRHVHFTYQSLETSEIDVRVYEKAAIVRNVQRNLATYQGSQMAVAVRVSQVWVDLDGQWRLAGIQFSPLAQDEGAE